jgi:MFS family permease
MAAAILVYGAGVILGPVVGGALADTSGFGWRWVCDSPLPRAPDICLLNTDKAFYLNLFIFAAMAPIYVFVLPSLQPLPGVSMSKKLRSIDWLGVVLSCAIYALFAMMFTFGGSIWYWSNGCMIALYVVFVTTSIAFGITQYFTIFTTKEQRLFPGQFMRE